MAKQRKVVRVAMTEAQREGSMDLLESFRYAQLITVHRNDANGIVFDLHCPKGLVDDLWADMNSKRMKTFGFNAVVAPSARAGDVILE